MKQNRGISLISLVITIIVIVILAGAIILIAINGDVIGKAGDAKGKWNEAQQNELNQMEDIKKTIAKYTGRTSGETISKDVTEMENNNISYIGYFADVDNDGEVDGVIFADLLVGTDSTEYTIDTIDDASTVKNYEVNKDSYTVPNASGYGTKPVLKATGDGVDRFYVMALEDFTYLETKSDDTTETHTEFCWYTGANYTDLIDDLGLSTDFGSGETNTSIMKQTWNNINNYNKRNKGEYLDIWGVLSAEDWFVPSKSELEEFISVMGINQANSEDFDYIKNVLYWTSSQGSNYDNSPNSSRSIYSFLNFEGVYDTFMNIAGSALETNGKVKLITTF